MLRIITGINRIITPHIANIKAASLSSITRASHNYSSVDGPLLFRQHTVCRAPYAVWV